jgi:SAM-dependent methyltransferase
MSVGRPPVADPPAGVDADAAARRYWDTHVHDDAMSSAPIGSRQFFEDLDRYRFEKLVYLPHLVDFAAHRGRRLLEVGCGIGIDLARFARHGAVVTAIDLSPRQVDLARANLEWRGLPGDLRVMNGERMDFADGSFDVAYAHGVLQYTRDPHAMLREIHRVLRPGGEAILMVYNRHSWLRLLSIVAGVDLEHERAPYFRLHALGEFRRLLAGFSRVDIVPERFPVRSRLHRGLKATVYNGAFVGLFNALPRRLVRPLGWHLVARAVKGAP